MNKTALDIARWFAGYSQHTKLTLTLRKLQSLVYYAQIHWIKLTGELLYEDLTLASHDGPTISKVFDEYREEELSISLHEDMDVNDYSDELNDHLAIIWNTYYSEDDDRILEDLLWNIFIKGGAGTEILAEAMLYACRTQEEKPTEDD